MSFVDHPPDWLEDAISAVANWFHPEFENKQPSPEKKDDARGLVVPGYKYLGPFNGLDKGEPVDHADAVAKEHDLGYDELLKQGENPYLTYNHADAKLQADLQGDSSFGGNLANSVFQAKKRLLEPFGLVEQPQPELAPGKKRPRLNPAPPPPNEASQDEDLAARQPPDEQPGSSASGSGNAQPAASGGQGSDLVAGTMSGGGGAPMGDNQQGADGVGTASGDWHCDSKWLGDRVITRSTRTWVLPSYNNHLYRQIKSTTTGAEPTAYFGYSTPWGYFDFNRFHCHFSPRDWQRLVNNHWGFRPKSMHVKLFNIQVKEVTTQDGNTTIANNLTSTVQVFTDDEYQLPYVCGNATEGCLPAFPPQVFALPQYGYATLNDSNNPTERSSFFCLEYFPSKMLRTGNNFEFVYEFEKVPYHTGFAPSQHLMKLSNPLVDQYLLRFNGTNNNAVATFVKCLAGDYNSQYKNWTTGPHKRTQTWDMNVQSSTNRQNIAGGGQTSSNTVQIGNINYRATPETPSMCNKIDGTTRYATQNTMIFQENPTPPLTPGTYNPNQVILTSESETQSVNSYAGGVEYWVANNEQNTTTNPTQEPINACGAMPASVWMDRDVYLHGPIWAKIPHTGAHFHPSPQMGGFGLKHPPPMMLVKNTPVPGNVTTFTELPVNQFITQYSTGQVTVSIEWELMKENSKRWNPEIQYTNNYNNPTTVDFAPDASGTYRTSRTIGTRWLTKPL
nr:MAG: capsid protein [Canine parvovirus]